MSFLDDFNLDEDFTRDNSDDSDISSVSDYDYLYNNNKVSLRTSHKRSRQNDHKDSDVDWSGGEGSIETETDETPGVRKRPLVSRDDTLRSPSPGFQWDNDSNGDTSVTPSDADGSESGFPSSDGPDSSLDLDWDSFVCVREDSLPASNWEAEFLEHKNKVMAATNYKGLFYDTSIQDDEGQEEDPWYPYDPENVLSSPAALADDTVMPIESLDEELTICYGMIHRVRAKVLIRALDPLKRMQAKQTSSETYKDQGIYLFNIVRQGDGAGFLLHAPTADMEPRPEETIAVLNKEAGNILSEISTLCTFEAYSSAADWTSITNGTIIIDENTYVFLDIVIYGQIKNSSQVGCLLDDKKIFLQEPDYRESTLGYKNPHLLDLDVVYPNVEGDLDHSRSSLLQLDINLSDEVMSETVTSQTLKQKIATAFKNTSRAQNLERIKADKRVLTTLKHYQEEALDFIRQRETGPIPEEYCLWQQTSATDGSILFEHIITNCKQTKKPEETGGGILADEMGLGKTLTMLCAIIRTFDEAKEFPQLVYDQIHLTAECPLTPSRATLVVVPSSLLLHEWKHEIELHCSESFNINFYHGQGRVGNPKHLADSDIVLSTYHTIAHEAHDTTSPLWQIKWFRVILDEAHIIRRMSTKLFKAMKKLQSKYHWCLTGTPVQNSPEDLAALISFIGASPMSDIHKFRKFIINPLMKESQEGVENLRQLLDSVCLRRTRELIHLPESIIDTRILEFSAREHQHYAHIRDKLVKLINQNALLPKNQKKRYLGVFQLQLQLRRLCNHGTFQKLSLRSDEFDPQQAIAHLKQQRAANCESCGVKITGIQGIEEERSGNFTACGHLCCYKCRKNLESALQKVDGQDGCVKCSLCQEIVAGNYFLNHGDSPKTTNANRQLSAWQYFDRAGCSTKVSAIVNDIGDYRSDGKSIVFSCWTRSLDLVGMFMESRNIPFFRIDGTQTISQRKKILDEYQHDPVVKILLMTTGTGAFGLNLTVASCVYILEPQWNPMVEYQAIARVLRLGQTRNVRVVRYIMKDTVEGSELQPQQLRKLGYAKAGWKDDKDSHLNDNNSLM